MGTRSLKGNASRRRRTTRSMTTSGGGESQAASTTTKANAASLPPSPLTTLPAELIMKIACELDHRSYLQLALAWRPFLREYAQGLDPWNTERQALKRACLDKPGLFQMILSLRYDDRDYNSDTDSDAGCSCCSYLRCAEGEVVSAMFCVCVEVHADKDAIIVALYDFMLLDSYRRHSELPLFSKTLNITFHRAAAIAELVFDKRRAQGIVVGACPHDRPPFEFAVCHPFDINDPDMRYTKEADVRKALGHADLPLSTLELLAVHDDARYDDETRFIVRALTEGDNRLKAVTVIPCRSTSAIMDAVGQGCPKLTELCVSVRDEPTFKALIQAFARMSNIRTLNLGGTDLNDPARVQTLANAVAASATLHNLCLPHCRMSNEGVEHLAQVLCRNTSMRSLALAYNYLVDDTGACALAEALRSNPSTAIRDLFLGSTQVGDEGAFALAKALVGNKSVAALDLRDTLVGVVGIAALDKLRIIRPLMRVVNDKELIALAEAFVVHGDTCWNKTKRFIARLLGVGSNNVDPSANSNVESGTSMLERSRAVVKPLLIDIKLDRDQFDEDDEEDYDDSEDESDFDDYDEDEDDYDFDESGDEDENDEDDEDTTETTEGVR